MEQAKGIKDIAEMHHDFHMKRREELIGVVKKRREELMQSPDKYSTLQKSSGKKRPMSRTSRRSNSRLMKSQNEGAKTERKQRAESGKSRRSQTST